MTWHRIRSVSVTGGFLDGAKFDFCDGLNCFIGARGTGKTTVLELVRYALDALPRRDDQGIECRRLESLIERNLAGGRVDVMVETEQGLSYVVSRSNGEDPQIKKGDGRIVEWDAGAGSFFRADIYSQNEVESIADRVTSQLSLLDNFEPQNIADVNGQLHAAVLALTVNERRTVPLKERINELSEELATLPCVREKIEALTESHGEDADQVNRAHKHKSLRDREVRLVTNASVMLSQVQRIAHDLLGRIERDWLKIADQDVANGPNGLLMEEISCTVHRCSREADELIHRCEEVIAATIGQVTDIADRLKDKHAGQETEYRDLIAKHEQAQGQAVERTRWERRHNDLLQKDRERQQHMDQLEAERLERVNLLERLSELRDQRFSIRQRIAERINRELSPSIRVSIVQFGDTSDYVSLLESNLTLAKVRHHVVASKLAKNICPVDLADALARRDKNVLMERAELNVEQADKVVTALSNDTFLYALEAVELSDSPKIELCDGGIYKESCSLSTGQKCTAILPILLLDSDHPLLVDQPEDNLDNRFIYESVVDTILKRKTHRQLIFVTHNPNIPVLGDAGRVFVLESDGTQARKSHEGSVDECRTEIVTLLEGGEEAFKARKKRYAYQ